MRRIVPPILALLSVLALADAAVARSWPHDDSDDVFSRRYRGADEVRDDDDRGRGRGRSEEDDDHQGGGSHDSGGSSSGGSSDKTSDGGKSKSGNASGDADDRFGK